MNTNIIWNNKQSRRRFGWVRLVALTVVLVSTILGSKGSAGHRAHLSDDLLRLEAARSSQKVRVIVHGSREALQALALRQGVGVLRWLNGGAVFSANGHDLARLAADNLVDHLSGDPIVQTSMSISNKSTGAAQTRAGSPGLLGIGAIPGVTGKGIGIAIVDSGIALHSALKDSSLKNKVVANVSFVTGDPSTDDAYGHGTHVAGIIAGQAGPSVTNLYDGGIAPGAQLVNVRVLGADGRGFTSDVIAGIDWVIENRALYNIRVMNLSLGHPVGESCVTDPLCEAVARAVGAGIVVVAAAGNDGRTENGQRILGGITSPGNSPFAITVGALNTWGTSDRSDDTVTDYSSRGPTKFDLTVKPDLAAPGNRIVSLEANHGYLADHYPVLHRAGTGTNAYMQLSGTSMAAPIVTGAAALLLQGTPSLGTAQVKIALQSGATFVRDGGLMGAGAGSLNIWTSRKIAANGLSSLTTSLLGGDGASGASYWDAGSMSARLYNGTGIRLLSLLDLLNVWSNPSLLRFGDLNLAGPVNLLMTIPPKPLMWGEVAAWSSDDQIVWGTSMSDDNGDQIVWGTSSDDDQIVWGTSTLTEPHPR
jgi:serine protease AprX